MRRTFIFLFIATTLASSSKACDICGCGVGNFNPYMFPHLVQKFVSIGYNYRSYETSAHDDAGNAMFNKEYYSTVSLAVQTSLGGKFQLLGYLPFQFNSQKGPEGSKSLNKIGDAVLMVNYKLFDLLGAHSLLRQTVVVGPGIKLPTGRYQFEEGSEKEVDNANFQAGTGSSDFILNGSYALRYKKFALSAGVTYKLNTANSQDYRFGNRLLRIFQAKYVNDLGGISIIPNIGVTLENMGHDHQGSSVITQTGGHIAQVIIGVDVNNRKMAAGISYNGPVGQSLSQGNVHAMPGMNVHVSYIL